MTWLESSVVPWSYLNHQASKKFQCQIWLKSIEKQSFNLLVNSGIKQTVTLINFCTAFNPFLMRTHHYVCYAIVMPIENKYISSAKHTIACISLKDKALICITLRVQTNENTTDSLLWICQCVLPVGETHNVLSLLGSMRKIFLWIQLCVQSQEIEKTESCFPNPGTRWSMIWKLPTPSTEPGLAGRLLLLELIFCFSIASCS